MNITVYCASQFGTNPHFAECAAELGAWIAEENHTLVYGGGQVGLMGVLADTALADGGYVIGVIPEFLATTEQVHPNTNEMIHVEDMSQRRNLMIEKGDAYIALPGGTGTLEEISEVLSHKRLGILKGPCIFYNVDGFYDSLQEMLQKMVDCDLYPKKAFEDICFAKNLLEIAAEICKNC